MKITKKSIEIGGRALTFEVGRFAEQATAAVLASYGETMVFASACMSPSAREEIDFFPLTVDYRESRYAAGKFPGGFFKREGRPSEKETLTSRCIDRPMRPLFPEGMHNEVQVLLNVISFDQENDSDVVGMIAAFAALEISDIPFNGPLGAVRIGRYNGQLVVNPTIEQMAEGTLNLTIAGSRNAIMMVEGGAMEEPEEVVLEALDLAHQVIREVIGILEEFRSQCGKPKMTFEPPARDENLLRRVTELALERIKQSNSIPDKFQRQETLDQTLADAKLTITTEMEAAFRADPARAQSVEALLEHRKNLARVGKEIAYHVHELEREALRRQVLEEGVRSDGRRTNEIRPITCDVGLIPRTHGSALFTRGQTQALVITTLGTIMDEQKVDGLTEEFYRKFMLHYNFPPYSVGEVKMQRGPGRREIGHGALAERALKPLIPNHDDFPYTIRLVSEIMESNGSSSMASVCGGSLALMDAGIPVQSSCAGIAMGLIADDGKYAVLSDILGVEDHLGDMDFKVTGTRKGITAFQMDLKIEGITHAIMAQALEQARQGRLHILGIMEQALAVPRPALSPHAPRIIMITIPVDKIRDVIGPGGKMIRKITEETGAKIEIEDDGRVVIASVNEDAAKRAREWIEILTEEVEVGKVYKGKVTRIVTFGAFVEVLPGQEGLVHISELHDQRVNVVTDVLNEGDVVHVKVIEIDEFNRINLSKKEADRELGITPPPLPASRGGVRENRGGGHRGGGDRGDRGGRGEGGGGGGGGHRGPRSGGGGGGGRR